MQPGWYPDPDDAGARRYWDGQHWSTPLPSAASPPLPLSKLPHWLIPALIAAVIVAAAIAVPLLVLNSSPVPRLVHGKLSHAYVERLAEGQKFTTCRPPAHTAQQLRDCKQKVTGYYKHVVCNDGRDMPLYLPPGTLRNEPHGFYMDTKNGHAEYQCRMAPNAWEYIVITNPHTGAFTLGGMKH